MKYEILFENFITVVKEAVPSNTKVSAVLADILQIEKEAVYRRLRKEVPFTFTEIARVCHNLGLSLDNMIGSIPAKSRPLTITLIDYIDPAEIDYDMMDAYIGFLKQLNSAQPTEMGTGCNVLPQPLYLKYEFITRFYLFKWLYLNNNGTTPKPISDINIPDRLRKLQMDHMAEVKQVKNINYILDKFIFKYLVEDIKHFESIFLITRPEIEILKQELMEMLDELEKTACSGRDLQTGNKVNIYISNINFETTYTFFESSGMHLSLISVFSLNSMSTQDEKAFAKVKSWVQSLKRVSTLISESGEKQRVMFFEQQRSLIESL